MTSIEFEIGDRIVAGEGDDREECRIMQIDGDRAFIAWQQGVSTWALVKDLEKIA